MAGRNVIEILIKAKNQAGTQLREVGVGLDKLSTLALAGGFAFAGMRFAETAIDLSKLGAQAERLETSFRRLAGADADRMLERLRTASRGTIDDMNLMLSANRAMMLGVTDSADTMARLLEVATVRGRAMGLTTQQAFNDLMTGIGRTSPMILDNLGIVTGGVKVYDDFAASIGKATADLSAAEKRLALVNKVLAETSGTALPDAAEGFEAITASAKNLRVEVGKLLTLGPMLGEFAAFLREIAEGVREVGRVEAVWKEWNADVEAAATAGEFTVAQFRDLRLESGELHKQWRRGIITYEQYVLGLQGLHPTLATTNEITRIYADGLDLLTEATLDATEADRNYLAVIQQRIGLEKGVLLARYAARQALLGPPAGTVFEFLGYPEDAPEKVEAYYADIARVEQRAADDRQRALEQRVEEHQRMLRSLIEEALFAPTQVTDRDWWETNLGQYEDKPDEFIRRLKSAATDAESAWRHLIPMEIMEQGGDAIRLYVAQMEDLFRAGRWEELKERAPEFDPAQAIEAAVRQVRERVMAERARAALIAQVLAHPEIRALGLTVQEQIDVGMAQPEIGGQALAEQTAAGFKTFDSGAVFVQTFKAQVLARQDEIVMIGQTVATYIAMGFRDLTSDTAYNWAEALGPALFDWLEGRGAFGGRP